VAAEAARSAKRSEAMKKTEASAVAFFYATPSALIGAALRFFLESCGASW